VLLGVIEHSCILIDLMADNILYYTLIRFI